MSGQPKKSKRGIAAVIACATLVSIGSSLSIPLVNFMLEKRGVSGLTIGLVTAMAGLASIAAAPLVPALLRRVGVMPVLVAGIVLAAASLMALYWIEPLWLWFVLRFLNGVGLAAVLVSSEFWINALVPKGGRGGVLGMYTAAQSLGFVTGPALIALLGSDGIVPFAVGAGLTLLAPVLLVFGNGTAPKLDCKHPPLGAVLLMLPATLLGAGVFGVLESGANLLPVYGLRTGYSEALAALLASAVALGNLVLQVPIGFISDRIDRRFVLLGCGIAALAATILMPFAVGSALWFFVLLVVWGGVVAGLYSVSLARIAADHEGGELVNANAAFTIAYSLGRLVGPAGIGGAMDVWDPHGFAAAMAAFLAIYVAVTAVRLVTGNSQRDEKR